MYSAIKTLVVSVGRNTRQFGLVCESSDIRLLMYVVTSHTSTNDSVSAAIVEHTTLLIFEEFQYRGHTSLLPSVMKVICPP